MGGCPLIRVCSLIRSNTVIVGGLFTLAAGDLPVGFSLVGLLPVGYSPEPNL